jgi:hypothetical protein
MKPAIATMLCKAIGHPGLRKLARDVRDSGRDNAMLFKRCPRCGVEIFSIEIEPLPSHRRAERPASA